MNEIDEEVEPQRQTGFEGRGKTLIENKVLSSESQFAPH